MIEEEHQAFCEEDLGTVALRLDSDCIVGSAGKILDRAPSGSFRKVILQQSTPVFFPLSWKWMGLRLFGVRHNSESDAIMFTMF